MLSRLARGLAETVLPARCPSCRDTIPGAPSDRLCGPCFSDLSFIAAPQCACCGIPFGFDPGAAAHETALCPSCIAAPPSYAAARALFAYDDAVRGLILAFKHADRSALVPLFSDLLAGFLGRLGWIAPTATDAKPLLVPVPLHPARLRRRQYNQAALLADGLAQRIGAPADKLVLIRRKATASQSGLSRAGRFRNVAGAFAVDPRRVHRLLGRDAVLIDDVMTTGATVEACAGVLVSAGARQVRVLTLARAVTEADMARAVSNPTIVAA